MSKTEKLIELKELLDLGLISQSDFDRLKKLIFENPQQAFKEINKSKTSDFIDNIKKRRTDNSNEINKCASSKNIESEEKIENNDSISDTSIVNTTTIPNKKSDYKFYIFGIVGFMILIFGVTYFLNNNDDNQKVKETTLVDSLNTIHSSSPSKTYQNKYINISTDSVKSSDIIDSTQNLTAKNSVQSINESNSDNTIIKNQVTEEDLILLDREFMKGSNKLDSVRDQLLSVLSEKEKNKFWDKQRKWIHSVDERARELEEKYKNDNLLYQYYSTKLLINEDNIRIKEILKIYNSKK
jgi:hypothetical protein